MKKKIILILTVAVAFLIYPKSVSSQDTYQETPVEVELDTSVIDDEVASVAVVDYEGSDYLIRDAFLGIERLRIFISISFGVNILLMGIILFQIKRLRNNMNN